jgi:4-amino-4-deoxy-L-arabinose transferase-like glycosyltransferase
LILLAYLPNILLVLFTIIVKGIRERWKILHYTTALILTFLICSPYLLYSAKNYGDPLIAVNVHAKWYRNMEFAGKPGFPGRADVERNAYCGDSLTSFEYMFKLHSLKEVVKRSARGFYYIHWSKYMGRTGFGHSLFLWFYFIGIVLLLTEGKWDFILFFLLISAPLSFIAGSIDMSWRIPLVNIPLAYMLCGYGINQVACAAGKYHTGESRTGKQDKIT